MPRHPFQASSTPFLKMPTWCLRKNRGIVVPACSRKQTQETWHPAVPDDFAALLPYYRTLNEHILFDTVHAAESYHRFYRSRLWSESSSFQCWQVDAVPHE